MIMKHDSHSISNIVSYIDIYSFINPAVVMLFLPCTVVTAVCCQSVTSIIRYLCETDLQSL